MAKRRRAKRGQFRFNDIHQFLQSLFDESLHAKRVYSLANATLGVMTSAALGIHAIGLGLAQARGLLTKHAIKQVDRLLSNQGNDVWQGFAYWVPQVMGALKCPSTDHPAGLLPAGSHQIQSGGATLRG